MKLGSTVLNLNSVSFHQSGATQHPTEEEITVCAISRRSHGVVGVASSPRGTTVYSQLYWNIMKCDCFLLGNSSHKKKITRVVPPWQRHIVHNCAHYWGYHQIWMDSC